MASVELIGNFLIELLSFGGASKLSLHVTRPLGISAELIRFFKFLFVKLNVEFLEVPLTERSRINTHDSVLHKGLGSDKLIVSGVVHCVQNTGFAGNCFRTPREVAVIALESTGLDVASTTTDEDDSLGTDFGHRWYSSHFEFSLFLVNWHAATSSSPLVPGVPRNTHTS